MTCSFVHSHVTANPSLQLPNSQGEWKGKGQEENEEEKETGERRSKG